MSPNHILPSHIVYGWMLSVVVHGMVLAPFLLSSQAEHVSLEAKRPYSLALSLAHSAPPPPPLSTPSQEQEQQEKTPQEQHPRSSQSQSRQQKKQEENYLSTLYRAIDKHKTYPRPALRRQLEASITISLTIGRDGRVLDMEVVDGTSPLFIDAAQNAVREAAPFEPFPSTWTRTSLTLTIPIHYRIERAE